MTRDKKELRGYYLGIRAKLSKAEVKQKSKLIFQKILNVHETIDKNRFGVYLATKNEVDTKLLIDKLVSQKKEVYLPRFDEGEKAYLFVKFSGWKELEAGYYGILQPKDNKETDVQNIDVIFIPGVAFDKSGVRLGWGTGTYDQLLIGSRSLKIGLCYDFQIADSMPKEDHDIKVDLIVTEKRVIKT